MTARVATAFVGCKVSQADGEAALTALTAGGLQAAGTRDEADVVVVHTCCVTAEAERKSRRLVRRAAAGGRRVVVTGCAATLHPDQFAGEGVIVAARPDWNALAARLKSGTDETYARAGGTPPDADAGTQGGALNGAKRARNGILERPEGGAGDGAREVSPETSGAWRDSEADAESGASCDAAPGTDRSEVGASGAAELESTRDAPLEGHDRARRASRSASARGGRTRFVLKVQDGCGGACSYCVVRLVRGHPRSTTLAKALEGARRGIAEGCGEVVLSGIDLGAWRDGEARLPELVAAIAGLDGLRRVRLSSLEPRHVDDALLAVMRHPRVARHLHVPLQSADDAVLRHMRRPYTYGEYRDAVAGLRSLPSGGMLSTDVIVGYPTEDEAAFARTLGALQSGLFGRVHVFAFSARPGTAAAELPPLPAALVKERMGRALAAAEAAALSARRAALGREAEVLVEERRDGLWRGYSSEYVRYALRGEARRGELVRAVADEVAGDGVMGTVKE